LKPATSNQQPATMALSKKHIAYNEVDIPFSTDELATLLKKNCPEIEFVQLMGSATNGIVKAGSDLDLAVMMIDSSIKLFELYSKVCDLCDEKFPGVRIDLGLLNNCDDPVYRFESLKGINLFRRDEEKWLRFYSIACREYEHQMMHYAKQRAYRRSGASEV